MAASHGKKSKHVKRDSFHRRRGLELNNPDMIALVTDEDEIAYNQQPSAHGTKLDQSQYLQHSVEYSSDIPIHPGMVVQLYGYRGLAMIFKILGDMIGCELEGSNGDCDGKYNNVRYFRTPPNCSVFVPFEKIERVLQIEAPPRFVSRTHDLHVGDVVMVSKSVGVGVVRHSSTHLIGCELNAPVGDCDGQFEGVRYFQVKPNHAVFVEPQTLKKIEAEDLLNKLNETVEKLQEIENDLQRQVRRR